MALVGRPEVVILDEPTAGMDPEARAATRRIVADLRDEGAAILLTSHDLADVERLADRIARPRRRAGGRGRHARRADGGGRAVGLRIRLDRPLDAAEIAALGAAHRRRPSSSSRPGAIGSTASPPSPAMIAAVTTWCAAADRRIVALTTVGGSLEDAYLELVGRSRERAGVAGSRRPSPRPRWSCA